MFLADRDRLDRVEVLSLDDGELVLYWELPPKRAARLLKALRADLITLDAGEFIARWENLDLGPDSIG
jgi:hypothetical protein